MSALRSAIASAMDSAGVDIHGAALYVAATDAIKSSHGVTSRAYAEFIRRLRSDPDILHALARRYVDEIAADMRGEGLPGHTRRENQCRIARQATQFPGRPGGGGQSTSSTQTCVASAEVDSERGPRECGDHVPIATPLSSDRDGAGHCTAATQLTHARPVREPSTAQRSAALAAAHISAASVLDTFRVRDGRAVGDLRMAEVRRLARENGVEHHVLVAIAGRYANAPSDATVRDLIKPADLDRFIREAREAADVA